MGDMMFSTWQMQFVDALWSKFPLTYTDVAF
jgi:hypothetical protein